MALNMKKLDGRPSNFLDKKSKRKRSIRKFFNFRMDLLNLGTYVTAPFAFINFAFTEVESADRPPCYLRFAHGVFANHQ